MDKSAFLTEIRKQTEGEVKQYFEFQNMTKWCKENMKFLRKHIEDSNGLLASNGEIEVKFEEATEE